MKKIILVIIMFIITTIFAACTQSQSNSNKDTNDLAIQDKADSSLEFNYFYRGFASVSIDLEKNYPVGTYVIETQDDWQDFMDKYVPGINYYVELDFSKYYLVVNTILPAKPTYSTQFDVKTCYINDNKIEVETEQPLNPIYAQNPENIENIYINIIRMSKDDIPSDIQNIYKKN